MAMYRKVDGPIVVGQFCCKTYSSLFDERWEALTGTPPSDRLCVVLDSFPWDKVPPEPIEICDRLGEIIRACRKQGMLDAIESAFMDDEKTVYVEFSSASVAAKQQFARIAATNGVTSVDLDEIAQQLIDETS